MKPVHLIIHKVHAGMIAAGTGIVSWVYIPIRIPVRTVWTVELTIRPHYIQCNASPNQIFERKIKMEQGSM